MGFTRVLIIDKIIYLTQGRVAPFYEPVEFGMADKMVAQALGGAYGLSKEEVLIAYSKIGDLGLKLIATPEGTTTPVPPGEPADEKIFEREMGRGPK